MVRVPNARILPRSMWSARSTVTPSRLHACIIPDILPTFHQQGGGEGAPFFFASKKRVEAERVLLCVVGWGNSAEPLEKTYKQTKKKEKGNLLLVVTLRRWNVHVMWKDFMIRCFC